MDTLIETKQLIVNQGLTFNNAFVTSPICCISRASIITGRYMHNTFVYNNSIAGGCGDNTWQNTLEPYSYSSIAYNNSYLTYYAGKYMNKYGEGNENGYKHIPNGWTQWFGLLGNSKYYDYCISDNGNKICKNNSYHTDYFTDVIKRNALNWLKNITIEQSNNNNNNNIGSGSMYNGNPILMVLASPAAHAPFTPAPQYVNTSQGEIAPRTPNWNITGNIKNSEKHELLRQTVALNNKTAFQSDSTWRFRHGTLRSVDDMVVQIYNEFNKMGILNNTYFIYTSDHGFHLGQWGMGYDKRQLYEHDIRVPFYISGPGISASVSTDIVALNIDIAPTIVDLITGNVPEYMDGRSLKPFLFNTTYQRPNNNNNNNNNTNSTTIYKQTMTIRQPSGILQQFMVEYRGAASGYKALTKCGGYPGYESTLCDSWNNTYQCVRSIDGTIGEINGTIYCRFICFDEAKNEVQCENGTPESQGEYYNMDNDPWQLDNLWKTLDNQTISQYETIIDNLLNCKGQAQCNSLRHVDIA